MPAVHNARRRDAAAVMMIRGEGPDLEVFLVERSPELRFFGGYWALPGGVKGPEDGPSIDGDDSDAMKRCGERELFEECGVVVEAGLRDRWSPAEREAARKQLLDQDEQSTELWDAVRGPSRPPAEELTSLCRVCTPPFAPVRYDTLFLLCRVPDGEEPTIWPGELVDGKFWKPTEALLAWHRGEVHIVPPVLILLDEILNGELDEFVQRCRRQGEAYADGEIHRVRFSPGTIMASIRTPTLPPATTTNCMIVGNNHLWIIDPATPYEDEQKLLIEFLDILRDEGRELAGILSTHHHPDHVGAINVLSRHYGLEVRGHQLTLDRLEPGFIRGEPLKDGDLIPLGLAPDETDGWELEVLFTPGHDQGHLCFRENRYDALIAGDMLSTISTIVIDPPEGHLRTYLQSLDKLLEKPIRTLFPAHGPAVKDGHRLVKQYIRHRSQREVALVKALREHGPATPIELVPRVYWEADETMYPLAERSLVAGLDKLAEDGRATETDDGWLLLEA